ncbi:5'-nucleotidase C-terminal domain-containing protein [uncultured Chloroflexus sp.]|uniref:5'-nucleotidase C-terminal domain-containing protein n=2 Tax=Chloroflexus TaxID=1107 RepID=UPI00262E90DD|nr:5'-nucleotidase C-terminal domain-containing protein [uncultured Chloroflexus sp.]
MEKISRRRFLKGTVALGAGALLAIYSDGSFRLALAQENPAFRMRILHTNDHHARIEPVFSGNNPVHGGVSRRKALIDKIRRETAMPTLLVDAGDVFQGTLYFNQYNGMADLEFYNVMGYEAMAVGNHEFDKGPQALVDFITRAKFPVLSANIAVAAGNPLAGLIKPRTIIEKDGRKIGIFSLTPEDTGVLSNAGPGINFTSAIEAARQQVAALKAEGVFTIIALTHVGINVDRRIAREVGGMSLIIGGHSHTPMGPMNKVGTPPYPELIAGPDGKPVVVVTDWEWGRWLGDITVAFNAAGTVIDLQGNPTEVLPSLPADQGFENRIAVFKGPIEQLRARVVGSAAVDLDGSRNNIRSRETNLGNLVAEAMLAKARSAGATLAITNGGGIRASIPAGPVTVGQILEVLPFGNTLALVTLTGAQVIEALNNGVSQVESGAGRFPQIAGFRFTYDPSLPAASRVTSVTVGGAPIDPNADYIVVTNNFMLTGGDGYSVFTRGRNQVDTGFILADVVEEYIAANSPVNPPVDGRIAVGAAPAVTPTQPEAPAQPVPVPATLPNTGGTLTPLAWLAGLGAAALASGAALQRSAVAEEAETVETEVAEVEQ